MLQPAYLPDSYAHLNASLAELVDNIKNDKDGCKPLEAFIRRDHGGDTDKLEALLRKGVYPYSYFTDVSVFDEQCLPPIKSFYNDMKEEHCSESDYEHALWVWELFGMTTLKDYCQLYVYADVLQLTSVLQLYRQQSLDSYGLDPIFYYSAPGNNRVLITNF